jgi:flagellum-specific peptidoglycan hydrolase FlgJ
VNAADDNHLDWRLLPSISVIESGGGKAYRNNNIFGWNNGLSLFPSIRSGIREVAYKLGKSSLYRNRDAVAKLHLYNPDPTYAERVLAVMQRISPVVNVRPVGRLIQRNNGFVYATD